MAVINLMNPAVVDLLVGNTVVTAQTSTKLAITYTATGASAEFVGNFLLSGGEIYSGTVTGLNYYYGGAPAMTVSGLNFSVLQMVNASGTGGTAIANLLYGGSDEFFGSINGESLTAWGGNDTVIALDGNDTVYGGAGNDDVNGNVGQDIVHGDDGADTVRGGKDNDTIYGDAGDDPHVNGNIGDDLVWGGSGNDTVYGGQDQDTLHGEAGNDLLSGDLGNDILYGEAGADRFALNAGGGTDWVADFNAAQGDRIQLATGTAYTVSSSGGQVMIDVGNDHIGLAAVGFSSFSSSWIVFV